MTTDNPILNGQACDACVGQPIQGVLYPVSTNGEQAPGNWRFVERCDACGIYDGDDDASVALARHLGALGRPLEIRRFVVQSLGRTQPALYKNRTRPYSANATLSQVAAAPAMLAALEAVQEAFAYTPASALPSDAGVDWEAVAEQVDLAIYKATNVGPQEVN